MADKKKGFVKATKEYIDLLYMTPQELTAKDIAELLLTHPELKLELWAEMNVVEVVLANHNSIDFESVDINFKTPSDISFVKNRGIKTAFAINICEDDIAAVTPYFEELVAKYSGFVCADSEDFTPVYAGSSKK